MDVTATSSAVSLRLRGPRPAGPAGGQGAQDSVEEVPMPTLPAPTGQNPRQGPPPLSRCRTRVPHARRSRCLPDGAGPAEWCVPVLPGLLAADHGPPGEKLPNLGTRRPDRLPGRCVDRTSGVLGPRLEQKGHVTQGRGPHPTSRSGGPCSAFSHLCFFSGITTF